MVAHPLPPGKKGGVTKQHHTCAVDQFAGRGSDFSIKFPVCGCDAYVTVRPGSKLGGSSCPLDSLSRQLIRESNAVAVEPKWDARWRGL